MKDYWREPSSSSSTEPETEIYKLLQRRGVKEYIADMEMGGDVAVLIHRLQEQTVGTSRRRQQGHRIFLNTPAKDLTTFVTAKCLVTCIADAMEGTLYQSDVVFLTNFSSIIAAEAAFEKAGVLHRDISAGNIMMSKDRGLLIDWDLCIVMKNCPHVPRLSRTVSVLQPLVSSTD